MFAFSLKFKNKAMEEEYHESTLQTGSFFMTVKKRNIYNFQTMFILGAAFQIYTLIVSIFNFDQGPFIGAIVLLVLSSILLLTRRRLLKNYQIVVVCYFILLYFLALWHETYQFFDQDYGRGLTEGFFYGAAFVFVNEHIKSLRYTWAMHLILYGGRLWAFNYRSAFYIVFGLVWILAMIYANARDQMAERSIFRDFYNKKEELLNFRHFVDIFLREPIIILNKSLRAQFSNKSFIHHFPLMEDSFKKLTLITPESGSETPKASSLPELGEKLQDILARFIQNNDKSDLSMMVRDQENNHRYEIKVFWVLWDTQDAVAIVFNDITDREKVIALQISNDNKSQWISCISHELKTPLNGIYGAIQVIEKEIPDLETKDYILIAKTSCASLIGLVNSIVDLQLIEAKKFTPTITQMSIQDLFNELQNLFSLQAKQRGLQFKIVIEDQVPDIMNSDRQRLQQVLLELLKNAFKFTSHGVVSLTARKSKTIESSVEFSVSDTGMGISQEDQNRLFKLFTRKNVTSGIGLGLTICREIITNLKGRITMTSKLNEGSRFDILVPITIENDPSLLHLYTVDQDLALTGDEIALQIHPIRPSVAKSHSLQEECPTDSKKWKKLRSRENTIVKKVDDKVIVKPDDHLIIVVDDNAFNLMVATKLLQKYSSKIKTAWNGKEAIELVVEECSQGTAIAMIFMDLQMPVMGGIEASTVLTKMMSEKKIPDIPIVALTANTTDEDKADCKNAGIREVMAKPIVDTKIKAVYDKFLN